MRNKKFLMTAAACSVVAALLAGCSQSGALTVDEGWVRAVPPGKTVTAGFAVLNNHTAIDCTIEAVSSPQAERVELHSTSVEEGVMRMRPMQSPAIAAGDALLLAPGGNHLMLFGLGEHASHLESIEIALATSCGVVQAELPVRRTAPSSGGGDHSHH